MDRVERYKVVKREWCVARITRALESCGVEILKPADPSSAPFEFTIRAPGGEAVDLVCYAFTANEYKQGGRPAGEHRFQLKYGGEFDRYHEIYFDPRRRKITLMFGVHTDLDLFIAVDPQMHNPTWFSMSVEFKQHELDAALASGWHGWERERSTSRRKQEMPMENLSTEAVCALRPEHFLRYIAFEKLATGLDTGERLLLWEKAARQPLEEPTKRIQLVGHPLERLLGLPAYDILDVVQEHFRLLVALRGSVAEHHLADVLRATDGVTDVEAIDKDGEPDFRVVFERRPVRIECKNTLRGTTKDGHPRVDFQKTRAAKGDPCSRYYAPSQFEVLAACLHPVTEAWEYTFCSTATLPPHKKCPGKISTNVIVAGENWSRQLEKVLQAVSGHG